MGFCNPFGGAQSSLNNKPFTIWKAQPVAQEAPENKQEAVIAKHFKGDKSAGAILTGPEDRFAVRCGCGGILELLEVQAGGKQYKPAEKLADAIGTGKQLG